MAPEFERTQRRPAERKTARPQPRRTEEPERVEEEQVAIGSLAMPSLSAAQLASRVKQAGCTGYRERRYHQCNVI